MELARLREETAELHRTVEENVDLVSPGLTADRYVRILQVFQAVFTAWESQLDRDCPARFVELWSGRKRAYRLMDDLETLGSNPDEAMFDASKPPCLEDDGVWLGALYVLEGSTLGGQVISRYLETHFGWRDGQGYSFFQGYGPRTGEMWRGLREAIETSSGKETQIVAGAHLTFGHLGRIVSRFL
ncbi:MAG TPA: biliverdin-producing heme oxygenase [Terracidiphilus sp.]|jgi:heme oxygenase